jgi:signal transduction histidine kinase
MSGRVGDAMLDLPEVAAMLCSAGGARASAIVSYDASTNTLHGLAGHGIEGARVASLSIDLDDLPEAAHTPSAAGETAGRELGFESPTCLPLAAKTDGVWLLVLDRPAGRSMALAETSRVARELHDDVAQTLFSIGSTAETLLRDPALPAHLRPPLASALHLSGTASRRLRDAIHALRGAPSQLELGPALEQLAETVQTRDGLDVEIDLDPDLRVGGPTAEVIYRVCREGLANVGRHARAKHCRIHCAPDDGWTVVSVEDDGGGIEGTAGRDHFGLAFLREAVEAIGGTLEVGRRHSGGTTLTARVPAYS